MPSVKAEYKEFQDLKDLKPMLNSDGPCVSIYMNLVATAPNQNAKANSVAWKELTRPLEAKLTGPEGDAILADLKNWDGVAGNGGTRGKSVAVFHCPSTFSVAWLAEPVQNRAVVGDSFYVRPLLLGLVRSQLFYILALSQKNVRLLRVQGPAAEEVEFPSSVKNSFDAYMNLAKPDHNATYGASAGPSAGHSRGIVPSTSTTREDKNEYLAHFFRQIDRGVNELLKGGSDPLVLAAVDYELAGYRSVNTYAHLTEEDVQGAPNSLKAGDLHARALEALEKAQAKKADEVLAEYNHKAGGGASNRLKDVVTAAHDGRVVKLVVSDSLESAGKFDEATNTTSGSRSGDEGDLVNDAVVQTILHGGQVLTVPSNKMPNGAPVAAVFRY